MFSETPGTPGRRQQMPRTQRSIVTPACGGAVERLDDAHVDQRVQLGEDVAPAARLGARGLLVDLAPAPPRSAPSGATASLR